jgi:hypothetical protein
LARRPIAFEAQPIVPVLRQASLALNSIDWIDVRLAAGMGRARWGIADERTFTMPGRERPRRTS